MPEQRPEDDARAALQNLLSAWRVNLKQDVNNGQSHFDDDQGDAKARAGMALRQHFKLDMRSVLKPPPVEVDEFKKLEGAVNNLLGNAPPTNTFQPPPRHRPVKQKTGIDVEIQTVAVMEPPGEIVEPPVPKPQPPLSELPFRPRCLEVENTPSVKALREKVKEAQTRLFTLDSETTSLTRQLKMSRIQLWEQQRMQCSLEKEIKEILEKRADEIHEDARKEHTRIEEEESARIHELLEVQQHAQRWSKHARQQDKLLQQDRDAQKGGDVHRILQRHPSGEVFLQPVSLGGDSDDDSDDDYGNYGRNVRRPPVRGGASSDEEESTAAGTSANGEDPPPPPSQQFRTLGRPLHDDDDDQAESSCATSPSASPSSKSGGGTTPGATPTGSKHNQLMPDDFEKSPNYADEIDKQNQVLRRIAEALNRLGVTPKQLFTAGDLNHDGKLSRSEMEKILLKFQTDLTSSELSLMFNKIDVDHNGMVDVEEFSFSLERLMPKQPLRSVSSAPPARSGASSDVSSDMDEPDEKNEWRPTDTTLNTDVERLDNPSSQAAPAKENSVVPPLPELSGLSKQEAAPKAAPMPATNADEVNEVSSEEIYSEEVDSADSSRSC